MPWLTEFWFFQGSHNMANFRRKAFLELRDQTDPHLYSAQSLPHCLLCLPDSLKLIRHPNTRSSWTATHKRMGTVTGVPYQQHLRRRARSLGAEEWMRKKKTSKIVILLLEIWGWRVKDIVKEDRKIKRHASACLQQDGQEKVDKHDQLKYVSKH